MALTNQVSNVYSVGLGNVGSYQVSGTPWMTGSTTTSNTEEVVTFPFVTKRIIVRNTKVAGNPKVLRVYFRPKDDGNVLSGKHFVALAAQEMVEFNVKCTAIYMIGETQAHTLDYEIFAELTNIPTTSMYNLTGSGITE